MGIREDIRSAFGSIATAIHEATATMRHGEESGTVAQATSRDFAEPVSDDSPNEVARFVANAADFPTLDRGAAVEVGETFRVVVSLKADPVGATYTIGVSDAFGKVAAAYSGTRRESGTPRQFKHPLEILALETSGDSPDYGEAAAPSYAQSWIICVAADRWPEVSQPQVSDGIEFANPHNSFSFIRLRVSDVKRRDGYWILRARPRGGA